MSKTNLDSERGSGADPQQGNPRGFPVFQDNQGAILNPPLQRTRPILSVLCFMLTAGIFVVDLLTPLGVAGAVPYVGVVLLSLWSPQRGFTILISFVCSVLTLLGLTFSPEGSFLWMVLANRGLALMTIWGTALLSIQRDKDLAAGRLVEQIAVSRERLAVMGELAAGVCHEFRNPLHGTMNCMKLIRDEVVNNKAVLEILDLAEEGLHRMEMISSRLLRLGRERKGSELPTDLGSLTIDTMEMVEVRAREEGIQLECHVEPSLPLVPLDPGRLSEAILNLLTNALDGCSRGDRVIANIRRGQRPGSTIEISISDNGNGIPPEVRDRIFDPFFTTKAIGKGSGLGLALVKKIVLEHEGQIYLSSIPSVGTRVAIELPIKRPVGESVE